MQLQPTRRLFVILAADRDRKWRKPPAWIFVLPAVNDGANPSPPRHAPPARPEVDRELDDESTGALSDHGVNDAAVV